MSFYRKHRPQIFSDLVGQDHIRDTLIQASNEGRVSHAYLFCGPRGTGKTTAARILAKAVNCLKPVKGEPCNECDSCKNITAGKALDVIEIDAASNRGIEEIRELRENVKFSPSTLKQKVYIIDEVHMLTREAFNALLKTLEEPPAHAMFILATTESHKVPATIISRTQRFNFRRVKKEDIISNLKNIAKSEKIKISDDALDLIAASAEGGHRDSLSLLEQIASLTKDIDGKSVRSVLGITKADSIFTLLWAIFNTNAEEGLKIAHEVFSEGSSMTQFSSQVVEMLRKILLYVASGKVMFEETEENIKTIKELGKTVKKKFENPSLIIVSIMEKFMEAGRLLKDVTYPIVPVEIAIVESVSLISGQQSAIQPEGNLKQEQNSKIQDTRNKQIPTSKDQISKGEIASPASGMDRNGDIEPLTANSQQLKPEAPASVPVKEFVEPSAEVQIFEQLSDDIWKKIVQNIKQTNNSLAALLRDARPVGKDGNYIVLGVKFAFHKEKISEQGNIQIIEAEIKKCIGNDCKVRCEIADITKKPGKPASEEELAEAAEEIFNS